MDWQDFYTRCKKKYSNDRNLLFMIEKFEKVYEDEHFESNERFRNLFYSSNKMCRKTFFNFKKYAVEFYEWLYEQGRVTLEQKELVSSLTYEDVMSSEEIDRYYFKSLHDVMSLIDSAQSRLKENCDISILKTVSVLSWYDYSMEAMIDLKKDNLNKNRNSIIYSGAETIVEEEYMSILSDYAEQKSYISSAGKVFYYVPSSYLLRTNRSEQVNPNIIYQNIKKLNSVLGEYFGKNISLVSLRNNGEFYRIYTYNINHQGDHSFTAWHKVMYQKWKDKYNFDSDK